MTRALIAGLSILILSACEDDIPPPTEPECLEGAFEERVQYRTPSVPFGEACEAETQRRVCAGDVWSSWSGTFSAAACEVTGDADCRDPDGAHGTSERRLRYPAASVPFGHVCLAEEQVHTCSDGTWSPWSGTATSETCDVAEPAVCHDPDTRHGGIVWRTRYAAEMVPFDQECQLEDQVRTCHDGVWSAWSGTYTAETCRAPAPRACTEPDAPHLDGEWRTRYAQARVPSGQACVSEYQWRSCYDGTWSPWSGSYVHETCSDRG